MSWPHNGAGAPEKADVTDWIAAGGKVEELWRLVENAEPYIAREEDAEPEWQAEHKREEKGNTSSDEPYLSS